MQTSTKRIIEFYCQKQQVAYCQGMPELVLPFLFMVQSETPDSRFTLADAYAHFSRFV